ncbi:MAG TPA: NAD(+)/NADH kinase [Chthonomonadaceae bacterium]|nr:NAD(+)/NADH kinase [Chthonomonadaceae bacterium]
MERSVGIVVHRRSEEALEFARQVIAWLFERHIAVRLDSEAAVKLGHPTLVCPPEGWKTVEFVITLGGDGTILTAARMASPCGVPILGVHMGRFGFIAELHPDDLFPHLEEILDGKVQIEERLMVRAEVWRAGAPVHSGIGLNDALVKSAMAHLLQLKTSLGGEPFATYPADGILVASPTGSTAYALSSGGPLVTPTVQALVIVPICPHTLSARPLVVPSTERIEIEIESDGGEVIFAVDGAERFMLQNGDRVVVRRADYPTRLIVLNHATFYRKVRERYLYGERLNG